MKLVVLDLKAHITIAIMQALRTGQMSIRCPMTRTTSAIGYDADEAMIASPIELL